MEGRISPKCGRPSAGPSHRGPDKLGEGRRTSGVLSVRDRPDDPRSQDAAFRETDSSTLPVRRLSLTKS
jgi:hypothetical protein